MRTGAAGRRGRRADPSEPTVSARLSRRARSPAPLGAKHWHCWDRECAALRRRVARHFRIQVPGKCMIPSPTVTTSVDSRRRANSANASVTGSSRSGSSSNTVVPSAAPSPARPTHGIRRLPDEAHRRVDADVDPLGRLVALLHRHGPVRSAQGPRGVGRLPHPVEHLLDSRAVGRHLALRPALANGALEHAERPLARLLLGDQVLCAGIPDPLELALRVRG